MRFIRQPLSSISGGGVLILTTAAAPGDTVHLCQASGPDEFDEIHLWAALRDSVSVSTDRIAIDIGGQGIEFSTTLKQREGAVKILDGATLFAGRSLRVWAANGTPADMMVFGYVNRGVR